MLRELDNLGDHMVERRTEEELTRQSRDPVEVWTSQRPLVTGRLGSGWTLLLDAVALGVNLKRTGPELTDRH